MMTKDASVRSGLIKAVVTVWLLAGVFAMHGLTGNHDAAAVLTHHAHRAVAIPSYDDRPAAQPPSHAAHQLPAAHPAEAASGGVTVGAASGGHGHGMGEFCLAMLTALALVILGALAWRSLRAAHPVVHLSREQRPVVADQWPPWAQPTLSKLCVLRT
jgi:hypothetical protein